MVEGAKLLGEALDAGARVEAVYVADGASDEVITRSLRAGVRVYDLAPGVLERVTDTVTPQPVVAVVAMEDHTLDGLEAPLRAGGFAVVGVDVRDPGNAGTLIRTVESAGAVGVILCAGSVEATNPKTVRASAGAVFHVPVVAAGTPSEVLGVLAGWGVRRLATSSHERAGVVAYDEADLRGPLAFVLGNEAHGLPADVDALVDGHVTIPMVGRSESLNVGMAAAVLCFEAARQRRRAAGESADPSPPIR